MAINLSKPYILVGPPTVGKSTVAPVLAMKLNIPWFDLDELIRAKYRVSISELFENKKEAYFRVLEMQCLKEFSLKRLPTSFVLATGGGAVTQINNLNILKKMGNLIYLKASVQDLENRWNTMDHPVLKRKSQDDMSLLLKERERYYKESTIVVEVGDKSPAKICEEILRRIPWDKVTIEEPKK